MKNWSEHLYQLLPAVYQIRDGEQAEALRMLLHVVGEQVQDVQDDIESLYDNWFIETCDDWVVPYLGDLVGFRNEGDAGQPGDVSTARGQTLNSFLYPRREIANVVRRRRRKGTLSVLEDLATDISSWPSRAVEFSESSAYFQNVRHVEPTRGGTARFTDSGPSQGAPTSPSVVASFNSAALNTIAHTLDVRQIQSLPGLGWYHPYKIGLFVWRRPVYSATRITPCRVCVTDGVHTPAFTFNRLGLQTPLYINRLPESDEFGIAEARNLPMPLTRNLLRDKEGFANTDYYGLSDSQSLSISVMWTESDVWELIPNSHVHVCDLRDNRVWLTTSIKLERRHVAIDPEIGLFLFGKEEKCPYAIRVSYHYAFGMDFGGGEYHRRPPKYLDMRTVRVGVSAKPNPQRGRVLFEDVKLALDQSEKNRSPQQGRAFTSNQTLTHGVELSAREDTNRKQYRGWKLNESLCIEITTNDSFSIRSCDELEIAPGQTLEIRSASRTWPLINLVADGEFKCRQPWKIKLGVGSRLILGGLQIVGETMEIEDAISSDAPKSANNRNDAAVCAPCTTGQPTLVASATSSQANEVIIRHTTFVPTGHSEKCFGQCHPSHASVTANLRSARICIQKSIVGTINIENTHCRPDPRPDSKRTCPVDPIQLRIIDSIVQAADRLPAIHANCCSAAHAELSVERSSVFGNVYVQQIAMAQNSLFNGIVNVQRRSIGYLRFCYLPTNEGTDLQHLRYNEQPINGGCCGASANGAANLVRTPQRFKCLPDTAVVNETQSCSIGCGGSTTAKATSRSIRLHPVFVSTSYGDPGYGQLALDCPTAILRGADDESELGVFHDLYYPQRMAALEARLQEYTPADMQSAVIYADDLASTQASHVFHRPR